MDNSAGLRISSNYDLLHPDGINTVYSGGSFILNRPNGLSNLSRVNFRAFKGELLPFTTITLPNIKADLILMSNGLKTVTMEGKDTIDMPGVEKYSNENHNVILSVNKAWTYDEDADSQVIANIKEIIQVMNKKLKEYFQRTGWEFELPTMEEVMSNNFFSYDYALCPWSNGSVAFIPQSPANTAYIPVVSSGAVSMLNGSWLPSDRLDYVEVATGKAIVCRHRIDATYDNVQYYVVDSGSVYSVGTEIPCRVNIGGDPTGQMFFKWGADYYDVLLCRTWSTMHVIFNKFTINGSSSTVDTVASYDIATGDFDLAHCDALYMLSIFKDTDPLYEDHPLINIMYRNNEDQVYVICFESDVDLSAMTMTSQVTIQPSISALFTHAFDELKLIHFNCGLFTQMIRQAKVSDFDDFNIVNEDCGQMWTVSGDITHGYPLFVRFNPSLNNLYVRTQGDTGYSYVPISTSNLADTSLFLPTEPPSTEHLINVLSITKYYQLPSDCEWLEFIIGGPVIAIPRVNEGTEVELTREDLSYTNADGILSVIGIDVKVSAVDTNNNTKYLNPRNGDYVSTRRDEFLFEDPTDPIRYDADEGILKGSLYIPQLEFESDYVMNFNLKIYTDPFMFEFYTDRDFDVEGNDWNMDINKTQMKYYASSPTIYHMIEQLILLKYNYNNITLRVSGFPNGDGVVFNMNDEAHIKFKTMAADATVRSLTVQLIGDDTELDPNIMAQLYGKVTLEVDWEL